MKQQINEIRRMQQLAGILKESMEDRIDPYVQSQMDVYKNYIDVNFPMLSPNDGANTVNLLKPNPNSNTAAKFPYTLDTDKTVQALRPIMVKVGKNEGPWGMEGVESLLSEFKDFLEETIIDLSPEQLEQFGNITVREVFEGDFIPWFLSVNEI
jgi:hypothetical protein